MVGKANDMFRRELGVDKSELSCYIVWVLVGL